MPILLPKLLDIARTIGDVSYIKLLYYPDSVVVMECILLTLLSVVTVLVLYHLLTKKENRYPPGPFVFPIVGNLPQLIMAGSLSNFADLYRKQFGNVSEIVKYF